MSVESSSQVIMASPDKKEQIGNVPVPLLRSKDEQELLVNDPSSEPNTVWGSKEYSDNWCLEQELTADGKRMANEVLEEWYSKRGYAEQDGHDASGIPQPLTTGYESYGIDTLKSLGANGDLTALRHLVNHPEISDADKQWGYYESYVLGGSYLTAFHVISLTSDARRAISLATSSNWSASPTGCL